MDGSSHRSHSLQTNKGDIVEGGTGVRGSSGLSVCFLVCEAGS